MWGGVFFPIFVVEFLIMSLSQKQIQWQHAFYEWHLHRTDDTADDELKARKELLSIIQENRRKKQQWTVGEVAQ
jgi:hypothetical protein